MPVHVVAIDNFVLGEHDENVVCRDFAISEKVAIGRALEPREKKEAEERKDEGRKEGGKRHASGRVSRKQKNEKRSRDKAGRSVGLSGRTYRKAKAVMDAAQANPKAFGEIAGEMDWTGKVDLAFREVLKIDDDAAVVPSHTHRSADEFVCWRPSRAGLHGCKIPILAAHRAHRAPACRFEFPGQKTTRRCGSQSPSSPLGRTLNVPRPRRSTR
ncbi:MAG: hypothetical protein JXP34_19915 [Planctomycetes bacterium]|nr:hypothetical protein [Planctomycetota bacterium]